MLTSGEGISAPFGSGGTSDFASFAELRIGDSGGILRTDMALTSSKECSTAPMVSMQPPLPVLLV